MFIDQVKITIKAGNGGRGHTSFHSEKLVNNGGPDGGDGGRGGSVVFRASPHLNNLVDFYYKRKYNAADGNPGGAKKCFGAAGADLYIDVPRGTLIRDAESGRVIADLFYEGDQKAVLPGGRGGLGNTHFATSTRQAPRFSQTGEQTTAKEVVLELKTIADVGLVGFPNAGKSTFLSVVTAARPKIAPYPFTTLTPNLGVAQYYGEGIVIADIPGLVEGAWRNVGLGHSFLRHIERTRMLVHIVDLAGGDGRDPAADYKVINAELKKYAPALGKLKQIVALNKTDLVADIAVAVAAFKSGIGGRKKVYLMSCATGEGTKEVLDAVAKQLEKLPLPQPIPHEEYVEDLGGGRDFDIHKNEEGMFVVTGNLVARLARNVVFDDSQSAAYFHRTLKDCGVIDALRAAGCGEGDTVRMMDLEFEFVE
ncbi:MAG: GTPase ObgE [Clostridiales bacterium]|jgi:GTP-binding protein|nr:GTPase ObgE [Clostridiales bacterium]